MAFRQRTQQTIADRLGISASTVSLALRGAPQVAEETRVRVREIADELGYQLRPRRATKPVQPDVEIKQVSFLTIWAPTNPFYSAVLNGAAQECRQHRIALQYSLLSSHLEDTLAQIDHADAILAVGSIDEPTLHRITALDRPVILVDNNLPHLGMDRVLIENVGGVYQAVTHLAGLGHRQIAFLRGQETQPSIQERLVGYRAAMAALGLAPIEIPCTSLMGKESLQAWLDQHPTPEWTALVIYNDEAAIEVLHLLQDRGIRVPDDVSLVGFDGIDATQLVRPTITTCHVPREQLGQEAIRLLLTRLQQPDAPTKAVVLDTTFVARDSIRGLES
jgi:LacI family transcriptional regulator